MNWMESADASGPGYPTADMGVGRMMCIAEPEDEPNSYTSPVVVTGPVAATRRSGWSSAVSQHQPVPFSLS